MSVCWNACPMCSVPVTFGGGSWMQYGGPCRDASCLAANQPRDSQCAYQRLSTACGSKLLSSAMLFLVRVCLARRQSVLDSFAHRKAQLLLELGAQGRNLLVQLRHEAHHQHALDVGGERLFAGQHA